ncbi:hypothetical protein A5780_11575 [Nocardia sp. 852002-20019_SCH5090214]|nr:hypothetical protein A5780_11575 [Nocardia sp. 852002-20019_SCH5090214]
MTFEIEARGLSGAAGVDIPFETVHLAAEPSRGDIETSGAGEQVDSVGTFFGVGQVFARHPWSIASQAEVFSNPIRYALLVPRPGPRAEA